jgi:hypothetical protein
MEGVYGNPPEYKPKKVGRPPVNKEFKESLKIIKQIKNVSDKTN